MLAFRPIAPRNCCIPLQYVDLPAPGGPIISCANGIGAVGGGEREGGRTDGGGEGSVSCDSGLKWRGSLGVCNVCGVCIQRCDSICEVR